MGYLGPLLGWGWGWVDGEGGRGSLGAWVPPSPVPGRLGSPPPPTPRATRLFCDVYNPQSKTYCKRLQVLCPEHSRDPKVRGTHGCWGGQRPPAMVAGGAQKEKKGLEFWRGGGGRTHGCCGRVKCRGGTALTLWVPPPTTTGAPPPPFPQIGASR